MGLGPKPGGGGGVGGGGERGLNVTRGVNCNKLFRAIQSIFGKKRGIRGKKGVNQWRNVARE